MPSCCAAGIQDLHRKLCTNTNTSAPPSDRLLSVGTAAIRRRTRKRGGDERLAVSRAANSSPHSPGGTQAEVGCGPSPGPQHRCREPEPTAVFFSLLVFSRRSSTTIGRRSPPRPLSQPPQAWGGAAPIPRALGWLACTERAAGGGRRAPREAPRVRRSAGRVGLWATQGVKAAAHKKHQRRGENSLPRRLSRARRWFDPRRWFAVPACCASTGPGASNRP